MNDNEILIEEKNEDRERFVSNLEIFAEQMYSDNVNIEVGIFRNADGEVVTKTPRELFVWFGRLKHEFFEIKEDLNLLDPEWTHEERLEKFYEYCKRMEDELDIENVPEEIDDWYFGSGSGALTYQQRAELLLKMFRVNDYLRNELQYKIEINDELRQLLLEQEVLFENGDDRQRMIEFEIKTRESGVETEYDKNYESWRENHFRFLREQKEREREAQKSFEASWEARLPQMEEEKRKFWENLEKQNEERDRISAELQREREEYLSEKAKEDEGQTNLESEVDTEEEKRVEGEIRTDEEIEEEKEKENKGEEK